MREYMARSMWLKSQLEASREQYDVALDVLVPASGLAEEFDGRLTQYLIQVQKVRVYRLAQNDNAARDSMLYAQRLQKKLVESITDEAVRQTFLENSHAAQLKQLAETPLEKSS